MADMGRLLISAAVVYDDLPTAMVAGIRPEWFEDQEHRLVYAWMLDYHSRYGKTPTPRAVKSQFPNYRLINVRVPSEFYIDSLREQRKRAILTDGVIAANEALENGDQKLAQEVMADSLQLLGREVSTLSDVDVLATSRERIDTYTERRDDPGGLTGIATGFPTLDMVTGGFHPEQFVLFGGGAKQGKSFCMMKSAIAAHDQGKSVLFVSFEMSQYEQLCRYDGIVCGVNSLDLLHRRLSEDLERRVRKITNIRRKQGLPPFIISGDITATTTVSALSGKIEQLDPRPDIVFVDGIYLMEAETRAETGSAQYYTALSRSLKRLAQRLQVPIIGSTQALSGKMGKDGAVTLHSLGWTSAWSQDADLILGVEQQAPFIKLRLVAGRNAAPREITLHYKWEDSTLDEVDEQEESDE